MKMKKGQKQIRITGTFSWTGKRSKVPLKSRLF
jgi:hypothetical protein